MTKYVIEQNGTEHDAVKLFLQAASSGRPNLAIECLSVILPDLVNRLDELTNDTPNESTYFESEEKEVRAVPEPAKPSRSKAKVTTEDDTES